MITTTHVVGGLPVNVHAQSRGSGSVSVIVLFLLHGRLESPADYDHVVQALLDDGIVYTRDLFVVTFDHRNHGHRLVSEQANYGWTQDPTDKKNNERHAYVACILIVGHVDAN